MAWLSRAATALFIVALPVLLITSNVRFLAGEVRFYERGFRVHDAAARTGLPLSELDRAAREIIAYFENDAPALRIVVNDNGTEAALFSNREVEHMRDVKTVMRLVFRANEVSLAYVLAFVTGVFLWNGAPLRGLAWRALGGVGAGAGVVLFVGVFALTGFESTWRRFHELVFTNDLWMLNPDTDRLIQMFPEAFWEESTYILAAMTLAEVLIIVVAALGWIVFGRQPTPAARGQAGSAGIRPVADDGDGSVVS
jgi:integral membrane protein (TIGR01906 family)